MVRTKVEGLLCLRKSSPACLLSIGAVILILVILRGMGWGSPKSEAEQEALAKSLRQAREADSEKPRRPRSCPAELPFPWKASLPLSFPKDESSPTKIPKIVHFIYGFRRDEVPTFSFVTFAAVASAIAMIKPTTVMLHCAQEPVGYFWELLKPHVQLVRARHLDSIFGNPITNYAHMSDIVRLEVLLQHGGIYLDADVVTLRPFDELLNGPEVVMGGEGEDGRVGLCNAVIAAIPNAPFLRRWYESYRSFNQSQWNYHSVLLPKELAKKYPESIKPMSYKAFHWPLWDERGMDLMMDSYNYSYSDNFAVHMWSHGIARSPYQNFSMPWCYGCHSTLVSMLKAYVPDPLISVVMPCFNQSGYILEAMTSVLNQTFPSWELIVVDDRSPDACGALATYIAKGPAFAAVADRVRVVVNRRNRGLAESRNVGIRAARGVWICALDADDKIHPQYFERAAEAMSLEPDLEVITSNQRFFQDSQWLWEVPQFDTVTVATRGPLPVMTLYQRRLWAKWGGYSSSLPWGNEDYDFWHHLLESGIRVKKLPGELNLYRYKRKSMMRDAEQEADTERAMMRTRHPAVYHDAKLLREHRQIMAMSNRTRSRLEQMQSREDLSMDDKACGSFWLALSDFGRGDWRSVIARLSPEKRAARLSWQPDLYYALAICESDGTDKSDRLLKDLTEKHPHLGRTTIVERHLENCLADPAWQEALPRRDIVV